ncbi:MAG: glycosyltransferase family 39 protein [Holophagales bacterium]|nr:glycosyltransferase family 39 protein [Holophagales bacterium]
MDASLTRPGGLGRERVWPVLAEAALLLLLVALSLAAVWYHQLGDSPTFDEAIHLFSGAEALEDGSFWLNPEHPPLLKLAGAFGLRPLRLATPCGPAPCAASPFNGYLHWFYGNSAPADRIVAAGRRPFPWVLALLVVALHLGVRRVAGPAAGLLAAGLVALDPGFVAHAAYVHTDVGASLAFFAVVLLAVRAATGTSLSRWLVLGLALGLALVTKFSTILLVPVVAAAPLFSLLLPAGPGPGSGGRPAWAVTRDRLVGAVLALGIGARRLRAVVPALRRMPPAAVEPRSGPTSRAALPGRERSRRTPPSRASPRRSGTTSAA